MNGEILTSVDFEGRLSMVDRKILRNDREAVEMLVQAILENKRLPWMIVDAWLKKNHCLLLPQE